MTTSQDPSASTQEANKPPAMMDFLIRFGQTHDTFRIPEIQALATLHNLPLEVVSYDSNSPFCHIRLPSISAAKILISRSILTQTIHHLWAQTPSSSLSDLHTALKSHPSGPALWATFRNSSWRFVIDGFQGSRSVAQQREIIESFEYLELEGKICMKNPEETFTLFELWDHDPKRANPNLEDTLPSTSTTSTSNTDTTTTTTETTTTTTNQTPAKTPSPVPKHLYLARLIPAPSSRHTIPTFSLKTRAYISTTSMDAELTLITANLTLSSPGKLFYDPFCGTGSFPLAAAHFGALVFGSDIDGRTLRGGGGWTGGTAKKADRSLRKNFEQYGLQGRLGDVWVADLTNSPVVREGGGREGRRWLDGIMCDPPYGVREGLRVLGRRVGDDRGVDGPELDGEGVERHKKSNFIPPKRPYSFNLMLHTILSFASHTLADNARLSFWMPTANDTTLELPIPHHPCLTLVSLCIQPFNKWSRRLITYRRLPASQVNLTALEAYEEEQAREREREVQKEGRHESENRAGEEGGKNGVMSGGWGTADDLNPFRRGYFTKFEKVEVNEVTENVGKSGY